MLKYEKKLHFDKYYDSLQSCSLLSKLICLATGIISYAALYYFMKYILTFVPDFQPWSNFKTWFELGGVRFIILDSVYFIYGLIVTCYGTMRLSTITIQNHSVRDKKSSAPKELLVNGCYKKVRHPMYGTFIILQAGFMLSLRSFVGITIALIILIFQYISAVIEEKKQLIPIFGEEYRIYAKNVSRRLLANSEIVALSLAVLLSAAGFLI